VSFYFEVGLLSFKDSIKSSNINLVAESLINPLSIIALYCGDERSFFLLFYVR